MGMARRSLRRGFFDSLRFVVPKPTKRNARRRFPASVSEGTHPAFHGRPSVRKQDMAWALRPAVNGEVTASPPSEQIQRPTVSVLSTVEVARDSLRSPQMIAPGPDNSPPKACPQPRAFLTHKHRLHPGKIDAGPPVF
jgi:hypothetical protein